MSDWKPTASIEAISARAQLNRQIREFFCQRDVMEVEVPLLSKAAVTDPFIDSIRATCSDREHYLTTSPEFGMKRLLAAGISDICSGIYSLGKAFRNGEAGRRHNPEFTMLEWYRPGFDERQLMAEVAELFECTLGIARVQYLSYRQAFERYLSIDPHTASAETLAELTRQHIDIQLDSGDTDTWLDLLISHVVEPKLAADFSDTLVFIYDYPATQAALAKVAENDRGQPVARRFEGFYQGMELCNGYWELTDSAEQAARFKADLHKREKLGLPQYPADQRLVEALAGGMPECAGVALGVDRLLMLKLGLEKLEQVIALPIDRA